LVTPSITRVVEHWLVALNIDLQDKGPVYESTIVSLLNESVASNPYITDYDKGVSKRLKLKEGEEEIDLLIRIGNVILIGEVKSIVTTDSPISQYRTVNTLKKASLQVKRKLKFVIDNLESVFDILGWPYDKKKRYKFVKCIINSGRMYAGYCIDQVPVCDEKILGKYFSSNEIPLISTFDKKTVGERHLAWYRLYDNFEELQNNIERYLISPPQVNENVDNFEYKSLKVPYINEDSYKLLFSRLVPKSLSAQDILKEKRKNSVFPLELAEDVYEELNEMRFFI